MIANKNILFVPGCSYQSPIKQIDQYLPEYLSKTHKVILFEFPQFAKIFSLLTGKFPLYEKTNSNFFVFHSFGILPFGRSVSFINAINHKINFYLLKKFALNNLNNYKVITFTPEAVLLPLNSQKLIYHVLDEYSSLDWWYSKRPRNQLINLEKKLLKQTAKIVTVSPFLAAKYKKTNLPIIIFPTPANLNLYFSPKSNQRQNPKDMRIISKPIAGFIGSSTIKNKIDWKLVNFLALCFPNINFVFIGLFLQNKSDFPNFHNVFNLGYKNREDLPNYVQNFDVCIIPYSLNEYGQGAYPVKIMEYLSLGKPVISSNLPSLNFLQKDINLIYTAINHHQFSKKLKIALKESNKSLIQKRIRIAKANSWENKIKEYQKILDY